MGKRLLLLLALLASAPGMAAAQTPATPSDRTTNVEVDPIRCWWRTSAGAVRIGELFDLSLTCAVLESDAVQVVPDESRFGSGVIQMAPFEVVAGTHPADLHSGQRRFFQYQYTLRVITPDAVGSDMRIPDIAIHYRVNSKIAANTSLQGRDLIYLLPVLSVRVASMVPVDAPDIRDASGESFTTAETLDFRAGVLEIAAITLMAMGSLMTLLVLVRVARGARQRMPADQRQLAVRDVLRVADRELAVVQRDREQQGWTPELIDRAAAATRIAAAAALGRPLSQRTVEAGAQAGQGRLLARGPRRGTRRAVSAATTTQDLSRAMARLEPGSRHQPLLDRLNTALATFTAAGYGREASIDQGALDTALTAARDAAREVKSAHMWPRRLLRRPVVEGATVETRA